MVANSINSYPEQSVSKRTTLHRYLPHLVSYSLRHHWRIEVQLINAVREAIERLVRDGSCLTLIPVLGICGRSGRSGKVVLEVFG